MKVAVRPPSSIRESSDTEIEDSNLGVGGALRATGVARFSTLRSADRGVETSLAKMGPRERNKTADRSRTAVQDILTATREPDRDSAESNDRAGTILALFARQESLTILEALLSTDDPTVQQQRLGPLLLKSHDVLDSFARLVTEGALVVADGTLRITLLAERVLNSLPHDRQ